MVNSMIYFLIFIFKIIENTLSTLRLIVVANGKKKIGAFLQIIISLVWIFSLSITIIDINKDILKIIFFVMGSGVGSYLGSIVEEKIAMGTNILICITKNMFESFLKDKLNNYKVTIISEKNNTCSILIILLKRKEIINISKIIKKIDKNAILISEKVKTINNIV